MSDRPYKDGEVLSIKYKVWISGVKLDMTKKACINSIDIKETVDGADTATIKISDPEFLYIEDDIFIEENTIKIELGWSNTTYRVTFDGFISAVDIEFANDGIPKLTITCIDMTHKMNREKKDATFSNCTSASVVKKIVQQYGYTCVVEAGYQFATQKTITQSNQTDIDFLQKLAKDEVYPFTARLVDNVFYYVKKGHLNVPSDMTLTYKKYPHEVISFSPKINKENKKNKISKASVDSSTKNMSDATGEVPSGKGNADSTGNSSKSGNYTYDPSNNSWSKH